MKKNNAMSLTSKDFFVSLAFVYLSESPNHQRPSQMGGWTYATLAEAISMSISQVHGAIGNLLESRLLIGKGLKASVDRKVFLNFIIHGARYAYPAVAGPVTRGFATGVHCKAFDAGNLIVFPPSDGKGEMPHVWPSPKGNVRGPSLAPLCEAAVEAALKHPHLNAALAAFDVLRLGKSREVEVAVHFFQKSLECNS